MWKISHHITQARFIFPVNMGWLLHRLQVEMLVKVYPIPWGRPYHGIADLNSRLLRVLSVLGCWLISESCCQASQAVRKSEKSKLHMLWAVELLFLTLSIIWNRLKSCLDICLDTVARQHSAPYPIIGSIQASVELVSLLRSWFLSKLRTFLPFPMPKGG